MIDGAKSSGLRWTSRRHAAFQIFLSCGTRQLKMLIKWKKTAQKCRSVKTNKPNQLVNFLHISRNILKHFLSTEINRFLSWQACSQVNGWARPHGDKTFCTHERQCWLSVTERNVKLNLRFLEPQKVWIMNKKSLKKSWLEGHSGEYIPPPREKENKMVHFRYLH